MRGCRCGGGTAAYPGDAAAPRRGGGPSVMLPPRGQLTHTAPLLLGSTGRTGERRLG